MALTPMKLPRCCKKGLWPQPQQALRRTRSANADQENKLDEKNQWEDEMSVKPKFAAITLGLAIGLSGAANAAWQPVKPIEFIATAGPGGGTDKFARAKLSVPPPGPAVARNSTGLTRHHTAFAAPQTD